LSASPLKQQSELRKHACPSLTQVALKRRCQYSIDMPSRVLLEIDERQAATLVAAVLDRRRDKGDPDLALATDDVLGVVRHVIRHRRVAMQVLRQDTLDALELLEFARARLPALPGVYDALEYNLLEKRRGAGLSLADIADRLKVSRQAVDLRMRRGRAASDGLSRSEHADRAHQAARGQIARWQHDRALAVRTVMRVLDQNSHELAADEDLTDMIEILLAPDDDRRSPAVTDPVDPTDITLLRRVLTMTRASAVFNALAENSRVRAAVEQGERLVAEYTKLTVDLEPYRRPPTR
jgi:transcriptional regulator with XRE-family HTH domain